MDLGKIFSELYDERKRQLTKGFTANVDDSNSPYDWYALVHDYNSWARRMGAMCSWQRMRRRYVQIAALAIAAIEAIDRQIERENSGKQTR